MSRSDKKLDIRSQSTGRLALKAGAWYVVSQLVIRGLTFLTTPIFTRLLSTSEYGVVRVYESWMDMLLPVFGLCIYQSMSRAKLDFEEDYYEYHSSVQALVLLFCALLAALLLVFRGTAEKLLSMNPLMLCVMLAFMPMTAAVAIYQNREKQLLHYKSNVVVMALCAIPATLISIAAVWYFKYHSSASLSDVRIVSFYLPQIIVGLVVTAMVFKRGGLRIRLSHWTYALRFSLPLIPHLLSMYVLSQCDRLMIKSMCGADRAAIFSLAVTLQYVLYVVIDAVEGSWLPWLFEKLKERDTGERELFDKRSREIEKPFIIMTFAACGLALLLQLAAPELIFALGGEPYAESKYIVAPLLLSSLFAFCSRLFVSIEKYNKKTLFTALCTMLVAAVNVPLNYIFIKTHGYIAAAYTTAFCYMLLMLIHAGFVRLFLRERCISLLKPYGIILCCGALLGLIMLLYSLSFGIYIRYATIAFCLAFAFFKYRGVIVSFIKSRRGA